MQRFLVENEQGPDVEFEGEQLVNATHGRIGAVEVWRTARGRSAEAKRICASLGQRRVRKID